VLKLPQQRNFTDDGGWNTLVFGIKTYFLEDDDLMTNTITGLERCSAELFKL
jgi:hypothetical protein